MYHKRTKYATEKRDKMLNYISTRDVNHKASSLQAVLEGLARDGGLYVPEDLSELALDYRDVISEDYRGMAKKIFGKFFPDYGEKLIDSIVERSYRDKFSAEEITPLVSVDGRYVLELFRGPTCAFKDVALSALPNLMSEAAKLNNFSDEILILTATSGDTGSAALHGFSDVPGIRIAVFYPDKGISETQRLQMVTQSGANTEAFGVRGNFDDAQSGVKSLFREIPKPCSGVSLSSANSINIGRLVPQVVYYFSAYKSLIEVGDIQLGDAVDYTVPTGNFGDIMAGYLAKQMGLPVGKLICASNRNDVLAEFLETGHYNKKRHFYKTSSPSMDILVSSNLERLLFFVCGADKTKAYMKELAERGEYRIGEEELARIKNDFTGFSCSDEEGAAATGKLFKDAGYLMDTHTAIAWAASDKYLKAAGNAGCKNVVLSTASPYKFTGAVLAALGEKASGDDMEDMELLSKVSGTEIPGSLSSIFDKEIKHKDIIDVEEMKSVVVQYAGKGRV